MTPFISSNAFYFMQYFISEDRSFEFVVTEDITKDFGLHNHTEHYVISFIVKGDATLFYNNVSVVLKKGDTFIIRPYMPHSVKVEADSQILSLCINKDLFSAQSANEISQTVSTKFDEISAGNGFDNRIKSELNDAMLVKPKMQATNRNEGTIPAEFIRYPTELYCVRSAYSGASSGSIAVCGTIMIVYAVL